MQHTRLALLVVLVVGLLVPVSAPATAQTGAEDITFVESDIDTDTTWSAEDGPYRVTQDVAVAAGASLRIAPGTDVQLAEGVTLTVAGSLVADGSAARPVRVGMTPGAPDGIRWGSIRYDGGEGSELTLRGATVRGGTNAVTVASDAGRVTVEDSTLRNHSESALRVVAGAETPPITVRRSTVRNIGGNALQVTPGFGAVGAVRVGASPDVRGEDSTHALSLVPGAPVTTDAIRVDYGEHGDVSDAGLADLVVHTDSDGTPERNLGSLVSNVERRDNAAVFHLDEPVTVAGDSRLVLRYDGVRNPETRGVYPVAVRFERQNVSQLPGGIVAPLAVGEATERFAEVRPRESTRVSSLTVRESTFADVNGSAVFVAADRVGTTVAENRISATDGSGVTLRAREFDGALRNNEVSASDAGVALAYRNAATLVASGNTVTGSATGVRVRQSGTRSGASLEATLRGNTLSGNERAGISVSAASATLSEFRVEDNTVADNGGSGVVLASRRVADGAVVANRIADNDGDGLRFDSRSHRNTRIADNTLRNNGGDGIELSTLLSVRNAEIADNRVRDGGGHAVVVRTELVTHHTRIEGNRLSNNIGAGVLVSSPVTHGGRLNVTDNTVAANAYGVLVEGALRATVTNNDIVFNTNTRGWSVPVPGARHGTGVRIAEGSVGAILERGNTTASVADLIADPTADPSLSTTVIDADTAMVLRTDRESAVRSGALGAISVWRISRDVPTGIALADSDPEGLGPTLSDNDIHGQTRGLVVDIDTLIDANTNARLVVDQLRTVRAEQNYWGAAEGPYHTSILPSGEGNPVVTTAGWVDFVPFAGNASGETYARPEARLDAPESAVPGETVTLSGAESTAGSGTVATYRFTVGENESLSRSPETSFAMPNQSVTVGLAVEDELGIDSEAAATATITPAANASGSESASESDSASAAESPSQSTTATTAENTSTSTAASNSTASTDGGIPLVGGMLGAIPSVAGFGLGAYGVALSLRRRQPPVSGFTVQGLVVSGVLIWMVAGLLTDPLLLRVGVGAALVWMAGTAVAYLMLKS